ncbi:MAG: ribosomal protein S18-alanine N-acetyltransferase [Nitrospirota bacterium]
MVGPSPEVENRPGRRAEEPSVGRIRPMTLPDLDVVLAIERASFAQPWTEDMFRAELTENPSARFFVAVAGGDIVGYIGGWFVVDELQVVSLAVRPDARRRRVASRLLAHLFDHAGAPVRRASLEVRRSNRAAIAMYERFGFRPAGVRRGYYDEPKEDAVLMERVV